jgi:hypothetical protein
VRKKTKRDRFALDVKQFPFRSACMLVRKGLAVATQSSNSFSLFFARCTLLLGVSTIDVNSSHQVQRASEGKKCGAASTYSASARLKSKAKSM